MRLLPGARLGPYEVLAPLGAGGMGEVYRARDPRLGREVAIKIVAGEGAQDPDRRARFEQEARAAAALNHPHILAVHDVGVAEVDGVATPYVVSELLEGESLRTRLTRGPVPPRTGIELGVQIAKGLAAAHEHGIVHRDLKPENLFLTKDGTVKVLDFGLAKLRSAMPAPGDGSTTLGAAAVGTGPGVVLGSVGYMAPEQVRGETVDHRADVFALGCVLYELVSGLRAFNATTAVETLSAILNSEPADLGARVSDVPGGLERIMRRCLAKDAGQRFQSARDLAFALEAVGETRSSAIELTASSHRAVGRRPWRERVAWSALVVAAVAAGRIVTLPQQPAAENPVRRLHVDLADVIQPRGGGLVRVSPDGRTLLTIVTRDGRPRVVLRALDTGETRELPNTDGAVAPVEWAPDGRAFLYRSGSAIKRRDVAASVSTDVLPDGVARVGSGSQVSWSSTGDILVVDTQRRLVRVSADGGPPSLVPLGLPDGHLIDGVAFLPDGHHYLVTTTASDQGALFLARLGGDAPRHVADDVGGRVVFVAPDVLVFTRQSTLVAQRFSLQDARFIETPVQLSADVEGYSAAVSTVVVTPPGYATLVWRDRRSGEVRPVGPPGRFSTLDLSRDGRMVAVGATDGGVQNLWLVDAELGGMTRLTSGAKNDIDPRWSPNGDSVIFGSRRAPGRAPFRVAVRDLAIAPLFPFDGNNFSLDDWSADGRWVLYHDAGVPQLFVRPIDPLGEPRLVAQSVSGAIDEARLSPDGTMVAFNSDDSGRFEVFVAPVTGPGARVRVSTAGGVQPTWRGDGRELFFLTPDGTLMAAPVTTAGPRRIGTPAEILRLGAIVSATVDTYAPAPDGQRFLALQRVPSTLRTSVDVVLNWQQLLGAAGSAQ